MSSFGELRKRTTGRRSRTLLPAKQTASEVTPKQAHGPLLAGCSIGSKPLPLHVGRGDVVVDVSSGQTVWYRPLAPHTFLFSDDSARRDPKAILCVCVCEM